jgi:hypothetical protein
MHRAGFEPTIPVFERSKIVRVLDSAAIGTGPVPLNSGLTLSSHVHLGLMLNEFLSPTRATCPTHLHLLLRWL